MTPVVVYSRGVGGHHREYEETLAKELVGLGFAPTFTDRLSLEVFRRDVLFAMIEAAPGPFLFCAAASLVSRKRTIGLMFRPGECFRGRPKHRMKRALFRLLVRLPSVRVLTILPFSVEPRFAEVADGWVYDFQLWDSLTLDTLGLVETPLSQEVRRSARGRGVIVALGGQSLGKGFDWLAELWTSRTELRETHLAVIAGPVASGSQASADRLRRAGAVVVDRRVSAEELRSLYGVSTLVWAAYHPDYDQASGVAGRAFQFGIPVVVREGSLMARVMRELGHPRIEIEFADRSRAASRLASSPVAVMGEAGPPRGIAELRARSLLVLAEAFGARRAATAPLAPAPDP